MMCCTNWRRHKDTYWRIDSLFTLVLKVFLEKVAHFCYSHFILITNSMYKACILLKEHNWIEQMLFLRSFIHKIILAFEYSIIVYTIPEVLNHRRFNLLILYEYIIANIIEFPSSIDMKIMIKKLPLFI